MNYARIVFLEREIGTITSFLCAKWRARGVIHLPLSELKKKTNIVATNIFTISFLRLIRFVQ